MSKECFHDWCSEPCYCTKCGATDEDDYRATPSQLAALREELEQVREDMAAQRNHFRAQLADAKDADALQQRLADAERRNAVMSKLLKRCVPVCRYKGSHTERKLIDEIDAALNKPEEAKS